MSEPAKDEAKLMKAIALADEVELLRRIEEQTGWDGQWLIAAVATIAAIRAAGWAVVPQAELEILCAENARLREALTNARAETFDAIVHNGIAMENLLKNINAALEVKS